MEEKEAQYAEIIKLFAFVLHQVRLYSEKHPAAQVAVRDFFTKLEQVLGSQPALTFGLIEGRLIVNDHSLDDRKSGVDLLVREYCRLNVETLIFEQGLGPEEIISFLNLMALPSLVLPVRKPATLTNGGILNGRNSHGRASSPSYAGSCTNRLSTGAQWSHTWEQIRGRLAL